MDELQAEIVAEGNDLDENGIVDSFLHVCFLFRIPTANDKLFAWSIPTDHYVLILPSLLAASQDSRGKDFRLAAIGVKGDWVFLRKVP